MNPIENPGFCELTAAHEHALTAIREHMPAEERLYDLAELFKVFGDSTRIRILYTLLEAEFCVCHLAKALDMTQSAVSHQLRILKNSHFGGGRARVEH